MGELLLHRIAPTFKKITAGLREERKMCVGGYVINDERLKFISKRK